MSNVEGERGALIASVQSHQRELEVAMGDLRRALHRPFAVGEQMSEHPLPWLISGLLVGIWFGSRRS